MTSLMERSRYALRTHHVVLGLIVLLAGSAGSRGWAQAAAGAAGPQPSVSAPDTSAADNQRYLLQLGDVIEIKHFHNPELNERLPIRPDGRISLELVGEIQAAGITPEQLSRTLMDRYSPFVKQAEIVVIVREFGGNRIYVGGEVNSPGVRRTTGDMTLLQALVEAGGWRRSAKLDNVVILRNQGTSEPLIMIVDVKDSFKSGKLTRNPLLAPQDIVFVPKSRIARISDFMDQYVNEVLPAPVTLGLSYVLDRSLRR